MADDIVKRVEELAKRATGKTIGEIETEEAKEVIKPRPMFLPGLEEELRAMPNHVARSSLFAPIARGRKKYHNGTILVSRGDARLEYWGVQLNELHADITMQLIFEARGVSLGQPVTIHRAAFLRAIGWGTSEREYERFHRHMKELTAATLFIEAKKKDGSTKYRVGHTESFRILQGFSYKEDQEEYTYTLDPRWVTLFGGKEYSLIDWDKRLQIGSGQDMAKALQRLVATSSDPLQRYALDWLKEKMQYTGRPRDFRTAILKATQELERLEIIATGCIEKSTKGKEQLAIWLPVAC